MAQSWLERRLDGLTPTCLGSNILCVGCDPDLVPPSAFRHVWHSLGTSAAIPLDELENISAMLIFLNPFSLRGAANLLELLQVVDTSGPNSPPMILVPHTMAPEARGEDLAGASDPAVLAAVEIGMDGCLFDEHEGLRLALGVRAETSRALAKVRMAQEACAEQRRVTQEAEQLKAQIDGLLFDYCRTRLVPKIPAMDPSLPRGMPTSLGGTSLGPLLGKGASGSVYLLEGTAGVAKVMSKAAMPNIESVRYLNRMIDIMQTVSLEKYAHPNITQLYSIFHSRTHITFVMENGGPENLYRRLVARVEQGNRRRPLPDTKALSLTAQALAAVTHLHLGPGVCHRDLKPENFIVHESQEALALMLTDFDLAAGCSCGGDDGWFRSPCGTPPFTAPEVLLDSRYHGFTADVWSLGTVLLEVFCGVRCVERALGLPAMRQGEDSHAYRVAIAQSLRQHFSEPRAAKRLLRGCLPELQELSQICGPMLVRMLAVDTHSRSTSSQLRAVQQRLEARQ